MSRTGLSPSSNFSIDCYETDSSVLLCSSVASFIYGVCFVIICLSSLLFFLCLGKTALRDLGISWVSSSLTSLFRIILSSVK